MSLDSTQQADSASGTTEVVCPNCQGRGHILVGASMLSPLSWFLAPFERNDPDGLTRGECPRCDGEGYVEIRRG